MNPETGEFEVSDLTISLANGDLEFSKYPWNKFILNKPVELSFGLAGSDAIEYIADCSFLADGSITASCTPIGVGGPGDISVAKVYTLYKGIIKKEERGNKEFKLSVGDYTHKIFKTIPPRIFTVGEFPFIGTSVSIGTIVTDVDTGIIGRGIPYLYGDFTNTKIKPIFIDKNKHRYLIADHAIGTVVSVYSSGSQVFNYTYPNTNGLVGGTHLTGTNIMSFITFGTKQGTKTVYVCAKGRYDSALIENPVNLIEDILCSSNLGDLGSSVDLNGTSFNTTRGWLNPYKYRYIMNGEIHKNMIDLINDLCIDTMSNFFFDRENKANFTTYRPAVSRAYIKKISQNEILEDTFSLGRDVNDAYNRVLINYDYNYEKKEYKNAYEIGGTVSINNMDTVRTFTVNAPFIYTATEAAFVGMKWLSRLQNGINKIQFSSHMTILPIDIGDRVMVTHEEPPTSTGGWDNRLINIIEFEVDNKTKEVHITAIDEDEINTSKRYFILGNNTGGLWSSATEAQKIYGGLCSSGGTFSNNDIGCILW